MKYFDNNFALDLSKNVISQIDVVDKEAINQSIECILMTDQNERVFEPNFGSFLSGIVFERLDGQSAEKLLDRIITLILKYEKRISILSELCSMNLSRASNSLSLKIVYQINSDQTPGVFNKKIVF
jgi:hypothetical protein